MPNSSWKEITEQCKRHDNVFSKHGGRAENSNEDDDYDNENEGEKSSGHRNMNDDRVEKYSHAFSKRDQNINMWYNSHTIEATKKLSK